MDVVEDIAEVKISKRIFAYLIDIMFVYVLLTLILSIEFINPKYDEYYASSEIYSDALIDYTNGDITEEEYLDIAEDASYEMSVNSVSYNIVYILVIILYFGVFQKFNNGQTIGKKIMKIRVVTVGDKKPLLGKFLIRLLPMQYVFIGSLLPIAIETLLIYVLSQSVYVVAVDCISCIFLGIALGSFALMCTRSDKRGLHDIISGTKVVNVEE